MKLERGMGEFWDRLIDETEESAQKNEIRRKTAEEKYQESLRERQEEDMRRLEDLQSRYNFQITPEMVPALERLEGLAVDKYRMDDYVSQNSFKEVWVSIQHEVDLYEEGEESPLNKNSCRGAKKWLDSFKHLC